MKILILLSLAIILASAKPTNISVLQYTGVNAHHNTKEILVERKASPKCLEGEISPQSVFGGDLADSSVPKECKKSFITTLGSI
jgi:hypothetical protein